MRRLIALFAAMISAAAGATNVRPAEATLEPTMNVSNGEVRGCGVRLLLIEREAPGGSRFVIDGSIGVYGISGVLKAGISSASIGAGRKVTSATLMAQSAWISVGQSGLIKALPTELIKSEDAGYVIKPMELEGAMQAVVDLAQGADVIIGVRPEGKDRDIALGATIKVDDANLRRIQSCIGSMAEQMSKKESRP